MAHSVFILTETEQHEATEHIGMYSSLPLAINRYDNRRRSIGFLPGTKWTIEEHELDSDRQYPIRVYRRYEDGRWL